MEQLISFLRAISKWVQGVSKNVAQKARLSFQSKRATKAFRVVLSFFGVLLIIIFLFFFFLRLAPFLSEQFVIKTNSLATDPDLTKDNAYIKLLLSSEKELQQLNARYLSLTPKQPFIVVNTTDNRFALYRNRTLVREGFCSSGSYVMLKSHDDREWVFKTPKGRRSIKGKITSPVWRKPDWAFIEEGLPVPTGDHQSRFEAGVLGDYALSLGDGYLIHGTLYKRFLGMPVTHGCIRLNDEDLEFVYQSLNVGSKVYIY